MKIAIVHDELMRRGGAEQVVLCFHYAFPEAPIYTIAYRPELTYPEFRDCKIITSWFQKIAFNEKILKLGFFPVGLMAMKYLDVSEFDVVLISSTYAAKYVRIREDALVFNYCHSPFRLAWYPESYKEYAHGGLKKWFLNQVIKVLRKIDFRAAQRTDFFLANTSEMAEKIRTVYKPKTSVSVINPPVAVKNFFISPSGGDYYLVVSRLEYYKRVDIVVEAFNKLGLPLVIVGRGTQAAVLKKKAHNNITFKSGISKEELASLYSNCKAFIFPQIEDYGITPLEANASGRPVIAYGEGGVLETMIPYQGDEKKATAIFFSEQSAESLIEAIQLFGTLNFDPHFIKSHAMKFDRSIFIEKIKKFVLERIQ